MYQWSLRLVSLILSGILGRTLNMAIARNRPLSQTRLRRPDQGTAECSCYIYIYTLIYIYIYIYDCALRGLPSHSFGGLCMYHKAIKLRRARGFAWDHLLHHVVTTAVNPNPRRNASQRPPPPRPVWECATSMGACITAAVCKTLSWNLGRVKAGLTPRIRDLNPTWRLLCSSLLFFDLLFVIGIYKVLFKKELQRSLQVKAVVLQPWADASWRDTSKRPGMTPSCQRRRALVQESGGKTHVSVMPEDDPETQM